MDIRDVKFNLNRKVRHRPDGTIYLLKACIIRKNEKTGKFYYQAELREITHDGYIVYCELGDIEEE